MALNQTTENESGVVVAYWKVSGLNLSFIGKRGFITVTGFLTEDARLADKDQITLKQVKIEPEKFDTYFSDELMAATNPKDLAYKYIKENNEFFMDSTDALEAGEPIPSVPVKSSIALILDLVHENQNTINMLLGV